MAVLTVRNVSDEVQRALKTRAARAGRSAEAEVREILAAALIPDRRIRIGDSLVSLGRDLDLSEADADAIDDVRDRSTPEPLTLS